MKTINSPEYGAVPSPATFDELMTLLRQQHPKPSYGIIRMWRGQANLTWPIHSAAYRRLATDATPRDQALVEYEKDLLVRATHRGFRYVEGRRLSDFDLLARLQHHGAATRLVDATRNALVALYFAVAALPDLPGALIGLHAWFLGGYESQPKEDAYDAVIQGLLDVSHPQTWQPPDVSPRIAAQHSQFLYSSISTAKTGSLCIESAPGALLIIAISPALKRNCLRVLSEVFDIRRATLFPDIDGFGRDNAWNIPRGSNYRW